MHLSSSCSCCSCCIDFLCAVSTSQSSSPIFFIFRSYIPCTKVKTSIDFGHSAIPFVAPREPNVFILYDQSFQLILFIFTKYGLDQDQTPINFGSLQFHLWLPGGHINLFLVCNVNPRIFNWSISNSHHKFLLSRNANQFSALCSSVYGPCRDQFHFFCMCPSLLSFPPIFSKFAPNINWTKVQPK